MTALSLREHRKKRGIAQQEAAELAGVSLSTYVRWECTNDPRAWRALGLEPQGRKVYHRSQTVNLSLSPEAQERLDRIPNGYRSDWVSGLICAATIPEYVEDV